MTRFISCFCFLLLFNPLFSQNYTDSLNEFRQKYISEHEVVKGDDKNDFRFFPVNKVYRVEASFEKAATPQWITMETSGSMKKRFLVYGKLLFSIHDTVVVMNLYQSENLSLSPEYKDYLFLPFLDATSGETSYGSGRYIDLRTGDIKNGKLVIDFNRAYNPYCAYIGGKYNCPVPPKENWLLVAIPAGEMNFSGH